MKIEALQWVFWFECYGEPWENRKLKKSNGRQTRCLSKEMLRRTLRESKIKGGRCDASPRRLRSIVGRMQLRKRKSRILSLRISVCALDKFWKMIFNSIGRNPWFTARNDVVAVWFMWMWCDCDFLGKVRCDPWCCSCRVRRSLPRDYLVWLWLSWKSTLFSMNILFVRL